MQPNTLLQQNAKQRKRQKHEKAPIRHWLSKVFNPPSSKFSIIFYHHSYLSIFICGARSIHQESIRDLYPEFWIRAVGRQRSSPEPRLAKKTKIFLEQNIKESKITLLQFKEKKHWNVKYRSLWPTFSMKSIFKSHWLIIPKDDVHPSNYLWYKEKITEL